MKYTINVTQEHIDAGIQSSCKKCPIALALESALGDEYSANVGGSHFRVGKHRFPGKPLPSVAKRFIQAFDLGFAVSPFSFEIEVDDE